MTARDRLRSYLAGGSAVRPPFLPFATEFAARLEQVAPARLFVDANALTRTLTGFRQLFGLEALVVRLPAERADDPSAIGIVGDAVQRLRILCRDQVALVIALPGPMSFAVTDDLADSADALLELVRRLHPEQLDAVALVEEQPCTEERAEELADALSPIWNTASFYGLGRIFVAASAPMAPAVDIGADAVAVWDGVSVNELLASGIGRVGVPLRTGTDVVPVPAGAFYTSAGELPPETDIEWVRRASAHGRFA